MVLCVRLWLGFIFVRLEKDFDRSKQQLEVAFLFFIWDLSREYRGNWVTSEDK